MRATPNSSSSHRWPATASTPIFWTASDRDFTTSVSRLTTSIALAERGAEVVQRGVMAGGIEFAYVSAEAAGVPYIEIAHISPEIRAFFDHVKQEQR